MLKHRRDHRVSTVVETGSNEFQAAPRDAVRPTAARGDGPAPLQPPEEIEIEAGEAPIVSGMTMCLLDTAVIVAFEFDPPALCQKMQDALFRARYVHGSES
jgi:hypothetical protein